MRDSPCPAMARLAWAVLVTAALLATASCGTAAQAGPPTGTPTVSSTSASVTPSHATCTGFSLSLVSDRGGQSSPVAAAGWFAGHGGVAGVPDSGWHTDGQDESGILVRSGDLALHVVQGPDGTWQVDSGTSC
jgi:hypothetical protein